MGKHNGKVRKTGLAVGKSLENVTRQGKKSNRNSKDANEADPSFEQSVIEQDGLEKMMAMAELAGRDFSSERQKLMVLDSCLASNSHHEFSPLEIQAAQERCADAVHIPRRPQWTKKESAEELEAIEKEAFLNWRRQLAEIHESEPAITLTPYEKNLEVWRQLWRVLERSQVIVQVVDARNPLLYWSKDLENYVKELDPKKRSFLLLNKADLLTEEARRMWADYFDENHMPFAFWSAKKAAEENNELEENPTPRTHIHTAEELINLFINFMEEGEEVQQVMVGLVGYPNVGKSSTINVLFGKKKTPVAATPGRTKHFQTLIINEKLSFCDCPGLVLPGFAVSKAEMVAAGVIPIDRLVDIISPVRVILSKIGGLFLKAYGLKLPKKLVVDEKGTVELIALLAMSRGWTQASGRPDQTKAGRIIIKDFMTGKLLHCEIPPGNPPPLQEESILPSEEQETETGEEVPDVFCLGPGDDDLVRELVQEEVEVKSKPKRAAYKFHKKPPRRKGDRGRQYNNEGPVESSVNIKGNRGSLTNGILGTM